VKLQGLDTSAITSILDSCLLTDEELASGKTQLEWLLDDPLFGPDDDGSDDDDSGGSDDDNE
jgi:hypothetical protein